MNNFYSRKKGTLQYKVASKTNDYVSGAVVYNKLEIQVMDVFGEEFNATKKPR